MIVLNQVYFISANGLGVLILYKNTRNGEEYIKLRIGPKENNIFLKMGEFVYMMTQVESSMEYTTAPLSYNTCDGDSSSHFEKDYEKFKWTRYIRDNEIESVESSNEDLVKIFVAEKDLLQYYKLPTNLREMYES